MRADIMGLPALVPHRVDTSPIGAAMLAAVAAGLVEDLRSAAELVQEPVAPLAPATANRDAYENAYARYRRLFGSLKPMFGPAVSSISALRAKRPGREAGGR